jgi:hypothetical protein
MAEMHADGSGGSDFGRWRERKLIVEHAPWWREVGRRGTAWRASSGGGGNWLVARREVRRTDGVRGGVGGAVLWPEVPVRVEVLLGGNSGCHGSARRCSVAAWQSKARRSAATVSRGVRERRVVRASQARAARG